MKFAFFGSSLVSSYWNGAATYYRGIIRHLHARGHEITFYEPDAFGRQAHRDMADPAWARVVVYDPHPSAIDLALDEAAGADVIVKTSGVGVYDRTLEHGVLSLKRPNNTVLFWDVDAPATLDEMREDPKHGLAPLVPRFDMVMTYGGGSPVVNAYLAMGARACTPVYNALDPQSHHAVPADPRFAADLSFLGNRLPDREARVEQFFFDAARRRPAARFLLGGSGWDANGLPPNVRHVGHVSSNDHNAFNASARAVLNINRSSMARYGYSPATRIFEAAGAKACVITDPWEGIEQFLAPGKEVLEVEDGADLAELMDTLDPARAKAIGEAGYRRVLAEHTYAHRAVQIEAVLEGCEATTRPAAASA